MTSAAAMFDRLRGGAGPERGTWRRSLLSLPSELVGRVRGLFLLFALINAVIIPVALTLSSSTDLRRLVVGGSLTGLVWWWVRGYRRGRYPLWGELLEGAALAGVAWGIGQPTFVLSLLYVGLLYRSLYGSLPINILRAGLYLVAYVAAVNFNATAAVSAPVAAVVSQLPGFAMVALLMHVLSRALTEHASLTTRERVLAEAGAAFVTTMTREHLHEVVLRAASDLAKGEAVLLSVSPDGFEISASSQPNVEVGRRIAADLLWPVRAPVPRPIALDRRDAVVLRRAVGLFATDLPALAAPIVVNGGLRAALVVWGREVVDEEEFEAFDHLGSGIALAFERIGLAEGLQRSEERFRSLVQNASDVVSVVDADGTILYQTPSVERVLGYAPEDLIGTKLTDLVHPDELPDAIAFFVRAPDIPGVTPPMKWQMQHADGSWRHVELVGSNLLGDQNVGGLVLTARDVSERHQLEEQLIKQAFHDPLTGLANRMLFTDRVEHGLARASRAGEAVAVLMLDLDDFKGVNDTLGHAAGDELLIVVSDRLKRCVRPGDTIARLGGDEFAVLLEGVTTVEDAPRVAERVLVELDEAITIGGHEVFAHASIGLAVGGSGNERVDELLRMADVAMYIAKGRGKDRFEIFEPSMHTAALQHRRMKSELQRAVGTDDEFLVHYQPITDLRTGQLLGFEALVRWWHPEWGLVSPEDFIAAAEENGTIVPLGETVLRDAFKQVRDWQDRFPGTGPLTISVNVSSRQLQEEGFVDIVADALERTGLDPTYVTLEITERALMADTQATMERLLALKGLGLSLAIDDFGVGYSSLSYLRRFPIDVLKIDRAFVDGVAGTVEESTLARAIVRLAEALHLKTVAEGVETEAQAAALLDMGCTIGQGYLYAPPLDAVSVERILTGEVSLSG